MAKEITYEIVERIGSIEGGGNRIEINLISWNGATPKLDIRRWSEEGNPLKGLTFTEVEEKKLTEILKNRN